MSNKIPVIVKKQYDGIRHRLNNQRALQFVNYARSFKIYTFINWIYKGSNGRNCSNSEVLIKSLFQELKVRYSHKL